MACSGSRASLCQNQPRPGRIRHLHVENAARQIERGRIRLHCQPAVNHGNASLKGLVVHGEVGEVEIESNIAGIGNNRLAEQTARPAACRHWPRRRTPPVGAYSHSDRWPAAAAPGFRWHPWDVRPSTGQSPDSGGRLHFESGVQGTSRLKTQIALSNCFSLTRHAPYCCSALG